MADSSKFSADLIRTVKRSRFNPIRSLSPETLSRQLDNFATGTLRDFALTAEAIKRRDDVISVALPKREKAVSRRGYAIQVNDGLPDNLKARAQLHVAALKYCFDNCSVTHALDQNQRGGFRLLVRQMMEAVGFRYAVHELVWEPKLVEGAMQLTFKATYAPLSFFENLTGRLRFLPTFSGSEGQPMADDEWLVTVGEGIMEPLSVAYMFKQLSLRDWVSYSEKFGTPGLLGKTNSAKDSPEWEALETAISEFSTDWAAVTSEGTSIELIEAKGGAGNLPFPPLVDRMDRAISTICRGADLSTMSASQGPGQGASVQGDESDLLEQDDAAMITETLQQISRIVIRERFGDEQPLAYVQVVVPKKKDNADTRANVTFLVSAGVPVGQEWARSELGVPPPAKDEELLTAPPAQPQFGGPPPGRLALANEATNSMANEISYLARSSALASPAEREVLLPILRRLAALEAIAEPAAQLSALAQFQSDWPIMIKAALQRAPTLAAVFEKIDGTALVSGFVEHAQKTAPELTKP